MPNLGSKADSPDLEARVRRVIMRFWDESTSMSPTAAKVIALVLEEAAAKAHEYCFRTSTASYIEPVAVRNAAPYIEAAIRSLALSTEAVRDD